MGKMREKYFSDWLNDGPCCEGGDGENCKTCLTLLNAWRDEFYNRMTCALTHNLSTCNECRKCGNDAFEVRMNLIKELEGFTGKPTPTED